MAINLLTGLPGNGKTLFTISHVKAWAERENRPVFYHGIPELTLNWTKLDDPEKWFDCPPNSIIVIDECQEIFRPRAASKEPPPHVSNLETHRHKGIDLWLMTQHPSLADVALRRLTQTHRHIVRIFGMERATVHEWQGAQLDCEKESSRSKSNKQIWKFDKSVYGYYKSAEVHTVKRSIPARVIMLFCLPIILAGLVYVAYLKLKPKTEPLPVAPGTTAASLTEGARSQPSAKQEIFDRVVDAKNYVAMHTPRYAGLPHTAPIYDEVRKPTEAPLPVACVQSAKTCKCFTQQATLMMVPKDICTQIVENGFFDDAKPKNETGGMTADAGQPRHSQPVTSAGAVPASAVTNERVVVLERDGYGVLGATGRGKPQSAL